MSEERLLKVAEVAERLGTSEDWVYRHWGQIPGAWKVSRKQLRFRAHEFDAFLRGEHNGNSTLIDNKEEKNHAGESLQER